LASISCRPPRERWDAHLSPHAFFLVDDDAAGAIVAYGMCHVYGSHGDVRQVAVEPACQRRGLGRAVLAVMADRFRAAGCTTWSVEVLHDNAPALALYRAAGMHIRRDAIELDLPTAALVEVARATYDAPVVELARSAGGPLPPPGALGAAPPLTA
jgi:GNAT superfamily N-acetyltransferase